MDNLNNIPNVGNWGDAASKLNDNFNKIKQSLTTVENTSKNNKGYFPSLSALNTAFPSPKAGQTAYVYDEASSTYYTRNAINGAWVATGIEAPPVGVDISEYTKTGGSTKTTKYIDDTKANHGYDSSPKTLKEVDDNASVKMTNLLQNSSFENGDIEPVAKYDSSGGASILSINTINPISGNYDARLEVTAPTTNVNGRPILYLNGTGQNIQALNHVLYFGMSVRVNSGTPIIQGAHNGDDINTLNLTLKDGFNSWTVECLGLGSFATIYLDGRTLWDFNFDNLIAYDLTAIFGAGNEPTKEEMDLLISTLGIDYFEGEITIPAQKVMQWQQQTLKQVNDSVSQLAGDVEQLEGDVEQLELDLSGYAKKEDIINGSIFRNKTNKYGFYKYDDSANFSIIGENLILTKPENTNFLNVGITKVLDDINPMSDTELLFVRLKFKALTENVSTVRVFFKTTESEPSERNTPIQQGGIEIGESYDVWGMAKPYAKEGDFRFEIHLYGTAIARGASIEINEIELYSLDDFPEAHRDEMKLKMEELVGKGGISDSIAYLDIINNDIIKQSDPLSDFINNQYLYTDNPLLTPSWITPEGVYRESSSQQKMPVNSPFLVEELDYIEVDEDFHLEYAGFDGNGVFIDRVAPNPKLHYINSGMLSSYHYVYIMVKKRDTVQIIDWGKEPVLNVYKKRTFVGKDELTQLSNNVSLTVKNILLERGSLGINGKTTFNSDRLWRDEEFYNNFRSPKYMNVSGILTFNSSTLDSYDLDVYQYDETFKLIEKITVDGNIATLNINTKYVKISGKRKDNSPIDYLPEIDVKGLFDSNNIYTYNNSEYGVTQKALIEIGNNNGQDVTENFDISDENQSDYWQTDNTSYYTHVIIRTPKNYSANGSPVRVIYVAHGSGNSSVHDFSSTYLEYFNYLVDEGYMIVDVHAWSNKYPDAKQFEGTPTNISCTNSMYKYISDNYNIKRDGVFVLGKSLGGLQVYGAEYWYNFKILACAALSGTLDSLANCFGYDDIDRKACMEDFGVTEDPAPILIENGYSNWNYGVAFAFLKRNAKYFHGYVPLTLGAINWDAEDNFPDDKDLINLEFTAISRVPVKSWVSPDEGSRLAKKMTRKRAVERGGGVFQIRHAPMGADDAHHAVDTEDIKIPEITTRLGIKHFNIPVTYAEVMQWFRRWEI